MIYIIIAVTVFVGDLLLKNYIEKKKSIGKSEKLLGGKIIVTKYHNEGAFLNLFEKQKNMLLLVSGVMLGMILMFLFVLMPQKGKKLVKVGVTFLFAGAASNVYDRVFRGYVVDYFSFSFLKKVVFNISDIFIFIGSLLLAVWYAVIE